MAFSRHRSRRLVGLSVLAALLSGLGAFMFFLSRAETAPRGELAVRTMPLDPDRCTEGVRKVAVDDLRPAPSVLLWYPEPPRNNAAAVAQPDSRLPVLFYFSSWTGIRLENIDLVQILASHGFVVATVLYPARLPGMPEARWRRQLAELQRPMDFSSEAGFEETLRRGDQRVRARAEDAVAILNRLATLDHCDPGNRLAHRLDTNRAGIFGYSLGGAVAAEVCRQDVRFRAAANLDGWLFGDAAKHGVPCPYLLMSDDSPVPTAPDIAAADATRRYMSILTKSDYDQAMANMERHGGIMVTIAGSRHADFSDSAPRPLRQSLGLAGRGMGRTTDIVSAYVVAFMEKYLAGKPSSLLPPGAVTSPDVHLQMWERPTSAGAAAPVN
jgi:dienelactone hydrolase